MALKTLVKIGGITNLSDARYCAGMGVDMLGFNVIPGNPSYISPQLFQQIRGWVTGPLIVAEIAGLRDPEDLKPILENYRPDMLQMGLSELTRIPSPPLPYILNLRINEDITHLAIQPDYILGESPVMTSSPIPFLLEVTTTDEVTSALSDSSVRGISLNGGPELKPGLKDYSTMADILELLEVD
jgi:phosphoribosylanthranilate isomerase